jgi:hypothetical protein
VSNVVIILPSIGDALDIPASRQDLVISIYNISLARLMIFGAGPVCRADLNEILYRQNGGQTV